MMIFQRHYAHVAALLCSLSIHGCATDEPGIPPPRDQISFPTGIVYDAKRQFLYVTNSNANLKYNGATIVAVDLRSLPNDLSTIDAAIDKGALDCTPSPVEVDEWHCTEEPFIQKDTTLRLGDFPGDIAMTLDGSRMFVPVRGQNYVAWINIFDRENGGVSLRCSEDVEPTCDPEESKECAAWDCDETHRLNFSKRLDQALPDEPFGVYLNEVVAVHIDSEGNRHTCRESNATVACGCGNAKRCDNEPTARDCCIDPPDDHQLFVTHLNGGEVSLFGVSKAKHGGAELHDIVGGFFQPRPNSDIGGAFSLTPKQPGDAEGPIFVSSRIDDQLGTFVVSNNEQIIRTSPVPVRTTIPANDIRGIAFAPSGTRLFLLNRAPASLIALDVAESLPGNDVWQPSWITEMCADPSQLYLVPDGKSQSNYLLYAVCFQDAAVWVIEPSLGQVLARIHTGDGPNALAFDMANKRAFVTHFLENTLGVIDLDPSHESYRKLVLKMGVVEKLFRN